MIYYQDEQEKVFLYELADAYLRQKGAEGFNNARLILTNEIIACIDDYEVPDITKKGGKLIKAKAEKKTKSKEKKSKTD